MSEQKTMTVYLCLDKWDNLSVSSCDMSEYGYIAVTSKEVTFDIESLHPDNLRQLRIDSLEKNKKALLSDAQVKADAIEKQIQRLVVASGVDDNIKSIIGNFDE